MSQHHPPSKCRYNGRGGKEGEDPGIVALAVRSAQIRCAKQHPWFIETLG